MLDIWDLGLSREFFVAWVDWKADTATELLFEFDVPVRYLDFVFLVVVDNRFATCVDFFVPPDSTEIDTFSFYFVLVIEREVLKPEFEYYYWVFMFLQSCSRYFFNYLFALNSGLNEPYDLRESKD